MMIESIFCGLISGLFLWCILFTAAIERVAWKKSQGKMSQLLDLYGIRMIDVIWRRERKTNAFLPIQIMCKGHESPFYLSSAIYCHVCVCVCVSYFPFYDSLWTILCVYLLGIESLSTASHTTAYIGDTK